MRLTTECNVGSVGLGDPAAWRAGGNAAAYRWHKLRDTQWQPQRGKVRGDAAWRDDKRATKQKVIDNTPNRHMQSARYVCTMKQVSPVGVGSARLAVTLDGKHRRVLEVPSASRNSYRLSNYHCKAVSILL